MPTRPQLTHTRTVPAHWCFILTRDLAMPGPCFFCFDTLAWSVAHPVACAVLATAFSPDALEAPHLYYLPQAPHTTITLFRLSFCEKFKIA